MKKTLAFIIGFFGMTASLLAEPHAYPVPFVESEHGTTIHFVDLLGEGSIKIYTITGDHVVTLPVANGQLTRDWVGVKNSEGKKVATGVYIYLIDGAGQHTEGKLVVIR